MIQCDYMTFTYGLDRSIYGHNLTREGKLTWMRRDNGMPKHLSCCNILI